MSKKAPSRARKYDHVSFDDDYDDFGYDDYDDYWSEDYGDDHGEGCASIADDSADPPSKSKSKKPMLTNKTVPTAGPSEAAKTVYLENPLSRKKYQNPAPTDPFVVLSLDTCVHIARFLDLASISALSSVNKNLDGILSSDFLYRSGDGCDTNVLPCVRQLPKDLPMGLHNRSLPRGVARKFALESKLYSPRCSTNDSRVFKIIGNVFSEETCNLHLHYDALSLVTPSCEIITKPFSKGSREKSFVVPGNNLLCSAFHSGSDDLCATYANSGVSHRVLSLTKLRESFGSFDASPKQLWHSSNSPSSNPFSMPLIRPSVHFNSDGSMVVLKHEDCKVFDSSSGKQLWGLNERLEGCTVHDNFVVGLQANQITIYDPKGNCNPLAVGVFPKTYVQHSPIQVYGGRVWFGLSSNVVMCTNRVVRDLHAAKAESSPVKLQMGKVAKTRRSMHEASLVCHGNYIYVSDGRTVSSFDRRNLSQPCRTFLAEEDIQDMQVDSTKIVYSTSYSRLGILPIDAFSKEDSQGKTVWLMSQYLPARHKICQFQFRGSALAVSYAYESGKERGEVRIYDIQREDCEVKSYKEILERNKERSKREREERNIKLEEEERARLAQAAELRADKSEATDDATIVPIMEKHLAISKRKEQKKKEQLKARDAKKSASKNRSRARDDKYN